MWKIYFQPLTDIEGKSVTPVKVLYTYPIGVPTNHCKV